MTAGVEGDPDVLRRTASGIRDTLAAVEAMAGAPYLSGATAFRGVAVPADALGHEGLAHRGGAWFDGLNLEEGGAVDVDPHARWVFRFGVDSNWLSIVDPDRGPGTLVEVVTGTLIGTESGALTSLWVKPTFLASPAEESARFRA